MAIQLSDLVGGSGGGKGEFQPTFYSGALVVPEGAEGEFITITPPAGKRAKLLWLAPAWADDGEFVVARGDTDIITDTLAYRETQFNPGSFMIGSMSGGVGGDSETIAGHAMAGSLYIGVLGDIDEVISVRNWEEEGGATLQPIHYSYCYGDC